MTASCQTKELGRDSPRVIYTCVFVPSRRKEADGRNVPFVGVFLCRHMTSDSETMACIARIINVV